MYHQQLLLTVNTIRFDLMQIRKKRAALDPQGAPKKTKQNEIRRCNSFLLSLFF